jgi:hypothetical protein
LTASFSAFSSASRKAFLSFSKAELTAQFAFGETRF